ncbi:TPA: DNA (cytosine-5-)-methyltransferase [Legionella pneumophila subsp. pneumophila]|nr:DNA (cytosine-5-)-methyltransferase [Legionella pneumophila subsp. pneumophila]HAT9651971.1 DNA (cytosine-5-)-methyltransferase [Legionella pneumophila subsp. pneumophila]HAT9919196.1 DNA (cytosine-5-)-methyltransferase [Legionella pneumophila subsp. pneumophila]
MESLSRENSIVRRKAFKFIDLFAGIGGIRIPFDKLNGECVFSSEIDPYCQKTYEANFGEKPFGDITKISPQDIPDHDILLGGFPCQAFSIIGRQKGFSDTRGTLFFNIEQILKVKRPRAFLLENVKQLSTHDGGRTFQIIIETLRNLGYTVYSTILNSLDFGVPQKRERTYIVGFIDNVPFEFPKGGVPFNLESILEKEQQIPNKYYASDYIRQKRIAALKGVSPIPSIWHENKSGNISTLPYSCALRATASYSYLLVNGERRLTEREMLRLQGFPDTFKIVCNYTQTRKQAGNAVTVNVIDAIAKKLIDSLEIANDMNEINFHKTFATA